MIPNAMRLAFRTTPFQTVPQRTSLAPSYDQTQIDPVAQTVFQGIQKRNLFTGGDAAIIFGSASLVASTVEYYNFNGVCSFCLGVTGVSLLAYGLTRDDEKKTEHPNQSDSN